ncbi:MULTISPECIES: acetolactate synthase large subunit [unclassified Chelatococcus]|uniref:acetolactate synthase large subunit n=1 Tax=unclassified Chelatococcus TaxID=2638111 RepID=UPI001BCA7C05|nr:MULTISPECIES: acetolactate synthase large subunit [unclassified Chelatococcus]MBS7700675.1 acetolactate synthase large subunit [Chelatococcus sp. YT9]MBX3559106.1 acetolactate synthase large subunit [Chelatococcus sp.]
MTRTGADRLCEALLARGVDTCFANPGTSEMHFVAALDRSPQMRCVLGLFEGVVTGAADGYGRMADRPAATLLHLGPGLANGLANLHNARRAGTPVINIVGEHATDHLPLDAPLTSDIESLARPMSPFVRRMARPDRIAEDVADAWKAALADGVATLILPADLSWGEAAAADPLPAAEKPAPLAVDEDALDRVASALKSGRKVGFVLSGHALREAGLAEAGRIAAATGARFFAQGANGRMERGHGRIPIARLSFQWEPGRAQLAGLDMVVLIGAQEPVTFFGYPSGSGRLAPPGADIIDLAQTRHDLFGVLRRIADLTGAGGRAPQALAPPAAPTPLPPDDRLTLAAVNRAVASLLPESAIVCDEVISSVGFYEQSFSSAPHDYLQLTGGAIGIGIPLATGAAIACPGRKVIALQADGSGMYTLQGLWTQAREGLDVVTIIFANRSYAILHSEMRKLGVQHVGRNAGRMLDLDAPALDWAKLAEGMGVPAERVSSAARFSDVLKAALRQSGPFLIEASLA